VLSITLLVVCVACIVVAQLFILRSAFRAVLASRNDARLPSSRRAAEVAWAVLPAIALGFVLWVTWQESRAQAPPPPEIHDHSGHGTPAS
jgi:heme/copper-type cytochrome/quinol oxidase subunit 2